MKKIFAVLAIVAITLSIAAYAFAAEFKVGQDVSLREGEMIGDNLYVGGGTVTISGNVDGDAVAAGGTVLISGEVAQDALLAGGTINIVGPIDEDLRAAGGTIIVSAPVGGDAVLVGGNISILSNVTVGKDVFVAGGKITLGGSLEGNVRVKGGEVTIDGPVKGDISINAQKVTIGEHAVIDGTFEYTSPQEAEINPNAVIKNTPQFHKSAEQKATRGVFASLIAIWMLAKFVIFLIAALILTTIFKKGSHALAEHALTGFWKEALRGFLILVAVPVACVILFMTILGIPFAIIGGLLYITLFIFANIFAPVVLGSWAWKAMKKQERYEVSWKSTVIGMILFFALGWIPLVGWLIDFLFILVTAGTMAKMKYDRNWKDRNL